MVLSKGASGVNGGEGLLVLSEGACNVTWGRPMLPGETGERRIEYVCVPAHRPRASVHARKYVSARVCLFGWKRRVRASASLQIEQTRQRECVPCESHTRVSGALCREVGHRSNEMVVKVDAFIPEPSTLTNVSLFPWPSSRHTALRVRPFASHTRVSWERLC